MQALPSNSQPSAPLNTLLLNEWDLASDETLIELLKSQSNLYAQFEALSLLSLRHDLAFDTTLTTDNKIANVGDLLEEIYERAGDQHVWSIVRRCASLLGKYDINLEQAATEILVRQHALTLGRAYSGKATLTRPADSSEILHIINTYNSDVSERIVIQELVVYLGMLIKSNSELFADMHTLRVGHILQLIIVRQKRESGCGSLDEAFNEIMALPPYQLSNKLKEMLDDISNTEDQLESAETLHFEGSHHKINLAIFSQTMDPKDQDETIDWYEWREQQGSVGRENSAFYAGIWDILHHCKGLMMGEKLNSKYRLDSETILSQMTEGEQSFKIQVDHVLNKIQAPVYRQLTVEALKAMTSIFRANNTLQIDDNLLTDIIIGHSVRISWLYSHPEQTEHYETVTALAWQYFYGLPPHKVANAILDALIHLLDNN